MARKKKTANGINPTPSNTVNTTEPPKEDGSVVATNSEQIKAVSSQPKREWFTAMLYPEDPKHEAMLTYLKSRVPQYAYILHDRDPITQYDVDNHPWCEKTQTGYKTDDIGKFKKPHWHVVWKHWSSVRLSTVRDLFCCWCTDDKIKACTDRVSYIYYWTHDDPKSRFLGKAPYTWEEIHIHGAGLISDTRQIRQNENFVQFEEHYRISELLTTSNAYTLNEAYRLFVENQIQTTLTSYELTQIVRDLQFCRKDTAWKKLDEAETLNRKMYEKLHGMSRLLEDLDIDEDKRANLIRLLDIMEKNTNNKEI